VCIGGHWPDFRGVLGPGVICDASISQSGLLNIFHLIMSVRILIIGAGGREHALAWKLSKSSLIDHIYVCPGNPGTAQESKTSNIDNISPNDFPKLVEFAVQQQVCTLSL